MSALAIPSNADIVWQPIPGTSQELALDTRCDITLFTGERGPGKTITQLMRFRRRVGQGYGAFWKGVIFDRQYKNLDDLISQSKREFSKFNDKAEFHSSHSLKWVWPTGEELLFRALEKEDDYWNFHGMEFPYIGFNELTKYPSPALFNMMMSCNRSSWTVEKNSPKDKNGKIIPLPQIPLEVFATTNSNGPGHNWVKRQFIDPAPFGTVVRTTTNVFDPKTKENVDVVKSQIAIFGSWRENIYLSKEYIASLHNQTDENLRRAWLQGDWNITSGGALDDLWKPSIHCIPQFQVPVDWRVDRTMDWGSSHPFSIGWWAEANGETVRFGDGREFTPQPGSLIQIGEWYGAQKLGMNLGVKMSAKDVARGVLKREDDLRNAFVIAGRVWEGPADRQIGRTTESDVETIEKKMADEGVMWEKADQSPGSRVIKLQLVRDMLHNARMNEGPGLYFCYNCPSSISTLPVLPRGEGSKQDDVDTTAEDHPYDMVSMRVQKGSNRLATTLNISFAR